jgi:hypothetical protein
VPGTLAVAFNWAAPSGIPYAIGPSGVQATVGVAAATRIVKVASAGW